MKTINVTEFSLIIKNTDLILRDHRVHKVRIMPGVTFIDIIYRYLSSKGFNSGEIELRNLLFKEPIYTSGEFDRKVQVRFEKESDYWVVNAASQKVKNDEIINQEWAENFQCELHLTNALESRVIDIEQLKNSASSSGDMDEAYAKARKVDINHYEFMKGLGDIYQGNGYLLAEIYLSDLARLYLERFYLHPAYLDASTIAFFKHVKLDGFNEKPFIPIHIESFRANDRLGDKCFVYINEKSISIPSNDVVYADIELFNRKGKIVAEFKRISAKQIRSKELITNLGRTESQEDGMKRQVKPVSVADKGKDSTNMVEGELLQMVADILNKPKEKISMESGFYDQGLDSSQLLRLVKNLEARLGKQLYPTLLFEYTNIKTLAEYLEKEYRDSLSKGIYREEDNKPDENTSKKTNVDSYISSVIHCSNEWRDSKFQVNKTNLLLGSETILVFDNDEGLYRSLRNRIKDEAGGEPRVVLVKPSQRFKDLGSQIFEINPANKDDYKKLLDTLKQQDLLPQRIIYMWAEKDFESVDSVMNAQLEKGIYSLLYLSQVLIAQKIKDKVELLFVYRVNNGQIQPLYAGLSGFAKALYMENSKFVYKTVEIKLPLNAQPDMGQVVDIVLNEFQAGPDNQVEIKYEEGVRQVKQLVEINLEDHPKGSLPVKDNGVYLITGGAGGLGLIFAKYIAKQAKAKLILVGRSGLSTEKQAQVEEIEWLGSQVIYLKADVSERKDVFELIKSIKSRFNRIDGVIHSAGVIHDAFMPKKTEEEMKEVLAPKVFGTIYLDEALKEEKLDFFVLFSSVAGVIGNIGQCDYSYANSFMNNFADMIKKREREYGRVLSINWPLWQEGGMSVNEETKDLLNKTFGLIPLSIESGIKSFENGLRSWVSELVIFEGEKDKIRDTLGINTNKPIITKDIKLESDRDEDKKTLQEKKTEEEKPGSIQPSFMRSEVFRKKEDVICDEIAIIGLSGRYPMAGNVQEFWENLKKGKDCITEIPADRWNHNEFYDPDRNKLGKSNSKWGGFIDDVDKFDPLFFNISPAEAELMDPQERIFLETVWHTIEDAGYTKEQLRGINAGVFAGVMFGHYQLFGSENIQNGNAVIPNSIFSSIPNRVSYYFDFHGPSIAVDTACSSSLTAIHLACESIRKGESEIAIAGGVNLTIHPSKYIFLGQGRFTSSDGRCRAFGEGGDGYVPGEGVGVVLLKPLSKAIEDEDHIYAVIKGSSLNHGGRASGFTVPNPTAQASVISNALIKSDIDPRTISYIEAHGTGTSLGDPIEITGLAKAFGEYANEKQYCSIGSAKSNIGHLESAAGIAGLTKVLLQMKYKMLVPSIHSDTLNPNISFGDTPFFVQHNLEEWKKPVIEEVTCPRRAGISSFGAGGANAHIILEEYESPADANETSSHEEHIIVLSARKEEILKEYASEMVKFLNNSTVARKLEGQPDRKVLIINLQKDLTTILSGILKVDLQSINLDENLEDYGLDQVNLSEIVRHINNKYSIEMPFGVFSEYYSLSTLSQYILNNFEAFLCKYYQENLKKGIWETEYTVCLRDIAYTLQVGREAMEVRLAVVAADIEELKNRLTAYCQGNEKNDGIFLGDAGKATDKAEIKEELIQSKELKKIAAAWVSGAEINWNQLYKEGMPKRISLPGYPFAKVRCWISQAESVSNYTTSRQSYDAKLHPLIAPNTSTLLEQDLLEKVQRDLIEIVCRVMKINEEDIKLETNLDKWGFDSISIANFNQEINKRFNLNIDPAVYYEYYSIGSLARYLCKDFRNQMTQIYGSDLEPVGSAGTVATQEAAVSLEKDNENKILPRFAYLENRIRQTENSNLLHEPVAIVGISGAMPQSDDLEMFWANIEAGKDLITEIPNERWDWKAYYGDPIKPGNKTYAKWGGFMSQIDKFDAQFFDIAPKEAEIMDPQQRIFIETVWKTIEDAGYRAIDLSGTNTGVFVGAPNSEYYDMLKKHNVEIQAEMLMGVGEIIANRVSHMFNLHGPSERINVACASSLAAVHRAVEEIGLGNCDMAIAGGVNIMLNPIANILLSKAGMLSKVGRCKSFDSSADGYVRGEGVGAVLLKPLSKAIQDRDHIYAVIKGSAINHGGHSISLLASNPNAKAEVMYNAWEKSGIDPTTVSYVEASAIGSSVFDSIEVNALKKAFLRLYEKWGKSVPKEAHCGIGSVKTYTGNLEMASGMAGIFRVLLSMKHKRLHRVLHFNELNPYIELKDSPFYIMRESEQWDNMVDAENNIIPRRAGVSALGATGINVHVVLEEYLSQEAQPVEECKEPQLIIISAKNKERLKEYAGNFMHFLENNPTVSLTDMAFTLQVGREAMEERLAIVASSIESLKGSLAAYCEGQANIPNVFQGNIKTNKMELGLIIEGKEGRDFIDSLIKNRNYKKLAQLWVLGLDVDWKTLRSDAATKRIPLPTYPFDKKRYWFGELENKQTQQTQDKRSKDRAAGKELIQSDAG